jgi:hypothetical protein
MTTILFITIALLALSITATMRRHARRLHHKQGLREFHQAARQLKGTR